MSLNPNISDSHSLPVIFAVAERSVGGTEPGYQVIRRNGAVTPFDSAKITLALTKAFLAVEGHGAAVSRRVHDIVAELTEQIVAGLTRRAEAGRTFHIEDIQDQVGHRQINGSWISMCDDGL